jgi:hypothetical protein
MRNCQPIILRSASWRASRRMRPRTAPRPHIPAARCARVVHLSFAQGGRGECRVASAPAASCVKSRTHELFTAGTRRFTRHSRTRMVLTASFALSLVTGLSCHHRRRIALHQLDASVGASGPHDFTVRLFAPFVKGARRPPHPAPTSVTIAKRPSWWARDGGAYGFDLGNVESHLFLREGLDR